MRDYTLKLYHGDSGPDPLRPTLTRASGDGWLPGAPSHLSTADVEVDLAAYRRLECVCGRQAMTLRPEHRGRRYRLLATCACGEQVAL